MSDLADRITGLSAQQRALLAKRLRSDASGQSSITEPLAIIGMGCRFPGGANSPELFWELLNQGYDAVTEIPADRWDAAALYDQDCLAPGKMATRWGGFLDKLDQFDPEFFDITAREAERMDPQQRLLLETAWESIEDAGLTKAQLAGSRTGVFVGLHSQSADYYWRQVNDHNNIDAYTSTGGAHSIAANRLSYWLDLRGPSLAVDTACSASLMAVHLAVQSLRAGESDLAIVGGTNLILSPEATISFSKLQMMADDGRCKTFDERANGFVRGEGCGVIILKRLSDALSDEDSIHALIRGSAINQDGHTNGLTAPNGLAQQQVVQQALENGGVLQEQIGYVETHGTGTALGDPIEVEALTDVIGQPRADASKCALGSVKTNIGHLEGAAGIAGLIKTALCLQHKRIPPHLHFTGLNPHISLEHTPFVIPVDGMDWPEANYKRFAGVSSFGFGGTNAHMVLEEAPENQPHESESESPHASMRILPISARNESALNELAESYVGLLSGEGEPVNDIVYSAACHRTHYEQRLAVVGGSAEQLIQELKAFADEKTSTRVFRGYQPDEAPSLVFVCSGQGPQRPGMGMSLYQNEPVFRQTVERVDELLQDLAGWSVIDAIRANAGDKRLDDTEVAQPALFAVQLGIAELLKSWGIQPDAVVGHSVGEVTAAHIAGVLSLEDAVRVIYHRGRVMQQATGKGRMAAVALTETEAQELLKPYGDRLTVAAINDPRSLTLSGEEAALKEVLEKVKAQDRFHRMLDVDYAFHSVQIEPYVDELVRALEGIETNEPELELYSTVRGALAQNGDYGAAYWGMNIRQSVRFASAIESIEQAGYGSFVELSPHPVLARSIEQCLTEEEPVVVETLKRDQDEESAIYGALAALYVYGFDPDWSGFYPGGHFARLPHYPWQRDRYWFDVDTDSRSQATTRVSGKAVPDSCYEVRWQDKPLSETTRQPAASRVWMVFADETGVGEELAQDMMKQGGSCVVVTHGDGFKKLDSGHYQINAEAPEDYKRLIQAYTAESDVPVSGIVHLWSLGLAPVDACSNEAWDSMQGLSCGSATLLVQALLAMELPELPRIWFATQGAQAVTEDEKPAVAQAPIWGFGRVLVLEQPDLWGGLVDLDPQASVSTNAQSLQKEILFHDHEDQVGYRQDRRQVARLVRDRELKTRQIQLKEDAVYLVTGGLGRLGLRIARWLAKRGARHLVLTGRKGLGNVNKDQNDNSDRDPLRTISELEAMGVTVEVAAVDVSDTDGMTALLGKIEKQGVPLRGVIHAAGVVDFQPVDKLSLASLYNVLRPKVSGGWLLHELTKELDLDLFVLFSSGAALWGSKEMTHYAAANHFLDALAHYRHSLGLPALSVNWGWWDDSDIPDEVVQLFEKIGLSGISVDLAFSALESLIEQGAVQETVAAVDWDIFQSFYNAKSRRSFLEEIDRHAEESAHETGKEESLQLVKDIENAPGDKGRELLHEYVITQVATVLGVSTDTFSEAKKGFFNMGMDSIMTVELVNRLQAGIGQKLPPTLAFEYPSVDALTGYLATVLGVDGSKKDTRGSETQKKISKPEKKEQAPTSEAELEQFSEDELAAQLDSELSSLLPEKGRKNKR